MACAGVVAGVSGAAWRTVGRWLDAPLPTGGRAAIEVEVPPGASFGALAERLRDDGLLDRPELLTLYARWAGLAGSVKAGRHLLETPVTPRSLVERLVRESPRRDRRVTLPEGSNVWQVADALAAAGLADRAAFLAAAEGHEGRLFPDTYDLDPGTPPERIVAVLRARFDAVWADLRRAHPEGPGGGGLSDDQLVTLASIVEEEARVADERPRIARVLHNRLAGKMRLQCDPTCVYGEATWREVPTPRRCHDPDSRWSTYVIDGLPPTPISSPGRASLLAALAPSDAAEDADVLYFVALRDGTGRHHFSRTLAEHTAAVDRHLKGR